MPRTTIKFCITVLSAAGIAACTTYTPRPLKLEDSRQALNARTLNDAALAPRLAALLPDSQTFPPAGWDRAQLLVAAAERNASLREARTHLQESLAAVRTARALPNPTLGLSSEYNVSQAEESPWLWGVTFDFVLDAGLRRRLRTELADANVRGSRLDFAEAFWTLRDQVRQSLLAVLVSERKIATLTQDIERQESLLRLVEQRVSAGEAASTERLQVELELSRARTALATAQQQHTAGLGQLATALGLPVAAVQGQHFSWEELDQPRLPEEAEFQRLRDQALLARTDLERAVLDYQAREIELHQAIREQYPQLTVGPGYTFDHGIRKATLGLSFSLPILNRNQGPIAEATARREAAAAHALAVQAGVFNDIDDAWAACKEADRLLQLARQQSETAQALERQAQNALGLGAADRPTLLAAQLNASTQALALTDAIDSYQQALGKLETALRTPLSGPELQLNRNSILDGE